MIFNTRSGTKPRILTLEGTLITSVTFIRGPPPSKIPTDSYHHLSNLLGWFDWSRDHYSHLQIAAYCVPTDNGLIMRIMVEYFCANPLSLISIVDL